MVPWVNLYELRTSQVTPVTYSFQILDSEGRDVRTLVRVVDVMSLFYFKIL